MGMFLMFAGIAESNIEEVEAALQKYATEYSGVFMPVAAGAEEDEDVLIIAGLESGHVTISYPDSITDWNEVSQPLSAMLGKPVLSLHIHDSDFWMYVLFVNGEEVDLLNPIPDYWQEDISEDVIEAWAGNAATICRSWPGISEAQIANYLIRWNLDDDVDNETKAYPEDEYGHEDWQLFDFMKKVGLVCALDESGNLIGKKYHFKLEER